MKRSGFTMIELIFVIVILGILAAVAIPKLAATRDDAKIAAAASAAKSIPNEIQAYIVANNNFDNTDPQTMSANLANMIKQQAGATTYKVATITGSLNAGGSIDLRDPIDGTQWAQINFLAYASPSNPSATCTGGWTATNWANNQCVKVMQFVTESSYSPATGTAAYMLQGLVGEGNATVRGSAVAW